MWIISVKLRLGIAILIKALRAITIDIIPVLGKWFNTLFFEIVNVERK